MPALSMKLEGAEALRKTLDRIEAKIATKIAKKAMREGAKVVLRAAKARAPVDTGRMKRALIVRAARRRKRGEASFNVMFDTKKYPDLVTVTSDGKRFFYPAIVEYGTSSRPAKGFIRAAWDSQKAIALRVIMTQFRKGIEQAARAK